MFGTIVNTLAIIAGCLIGGFIKKGSLKNMKKLC